jgi:hypothetical protein
MRLTDPDPGAAVIELTASKKVTVLRLNVPELLMAVVPPN